MLSFSIDVICDTPACATQLAVVPMRVPNVYDALFQARQQGWGLEWPATARAPLVRCPACVKASTGGSVSGERFDGGNAAEMKKVPKWATLPLVPFAAGQGTPGALAVTES